MAGIFISYRQEDSKPWALLLCRELADVFGEDRIFLDKDTLQAGNWREQIHDALNQCPAVLVLMGRKWLTITDPAGGRRLDRPDDVHRQEVSLALSRDGVTVIPVLVDGASMPAAEELPVDIRALTDQQARELSDSNVRRRADLQVLIGDIEKATGLRGKIRDHTEHDGNEAGVRFGGILDTIAAIAVITSAVWLFFYVALPDAPLGSAETLVVTAVVALAVICTGRLWRRLKKRV